MLLLAVARSSFWVCRCFCGDWAGGADKRRLLGWSVVEEEGKSREAFSGKILGDREIDVLRYMMESGSQCCLKIHTWLCVGRTNQSCKNSCLDDISLSSYGRVSVCACQPSKAMPTPISCVCASRLANAEARSTGKVSLCSRFCLLVHYSPRPSVRFLRMCALE